MRKTLKARLLAVGLTLALALVSARSFAGDLPDYMNIIVGNGAPATKAQVADENLLALDIAMFGIYDEGKLKAQKNFLAVHPVILALFSNQGGKFVLYRPGKESVQAPEVPVRYQIYKSVGHSSLAVFVLAGTHLGTIADLSWMGPMLGFRAANQAALDTLAGADLSDDSRENQRNILTSNIKFMDACMSKGTYTFADIQKYTQDVKPLLQKNVQWAAATQVEHWMQVVKDWKELLGPDWDKTYALSNTLYVTRQNNVLFSVLAQFFGKDTINTQLFLFETPSFVTTADQMLELLIRTVADRSVGQAFFGNYYLMDYELMGGDARTAIEAVDKKYGIPVFLPPLVPFHSNEWPTRIDPSQGEGPATMEQIKQ
jgi:hypothetical protein